jgi:hypothetical protein
LRNEIIHDAPPPKPEDIDWASMTADERDARGRAVHLIKETALIEFTHWPFAVLDEQPTDRLNGILAVLRKRSALERDERRRKNH